MSVCPLPSHESKRYKSNSICNESCWGKLAKFKFTAVLPKLPSTVDEL